MNNAQVLKSFTALSFEGNRVIRAEAPARGTSESWQPGEAGSPDATTKLDSVREMLYRRHTTPYALPAPYRYWGLNE
jgi:hypothetical protein